jgi:RNA polymerase sigma-70 factor (ECF subfamily)
VETVLDPRSSHTPGPARPPWLSGCPRAPGDQGAWLAAQAPALIVFARRWAPSHADAEDIVQDGFVRFFRSGGRAADPAAYLYACVRSAALSWLQSAGRRARRVHAAGQQRPVEEPVFVTRLERDERHRALEAAVAALPGDQAEVVVLRIWGGLTFAQIGEVMGTPLHTAASRYRYAMESLRSTLGKEMEP